MNMLRSMDENPLIIRGPATSLTPGMKNPHIGGASTGAGFSAKDIMRMLNHRKWLIIISVLVFLSMGVGSYFLWLKYAPVYEASALIVVYPPKTTEIGSPGVMGGANVTAELLETRAKSIKTEKVFEFALKDIRKKTNWFQQINNADKDTMVALMDAVDVSVVPKTNFLKISMSGLDKVDITTIVNSVAEAAETIATSMYASERTEAIKRLDNLRANLVRKRDDADMIIKTLTRRDTDEDMDTVKMKHALILKETHDARNDYAMALNAWDAIKNRTDKEIAELPLIQEVVAADPAVATFENRKMNLEFQLEYERKSYGENHNVIKARKKQLQTAIESYEAKKVEVTAESVAKLKELREEQFKQAQSTFTKMAEQLKEADVQLKELRTLKNQLDNANSDKVNASNEIHQLEYKLMDLNLLMKAEQPIVLQHRATIPRTFKYPKMSIMVAIGLFLGVLFGLGIALLLEVLDTTIKSTEDVIRRVQLPVLGAVPHEDDVDVEIEDMRLAFLTNPNTIVCEAFRQIRTKLLFSGLASQHTSILVTSPMPSDGRTTVCLNLGHHLASGGQRVLLVEANFRQPVYRRLFKDKCPQEGLSAVLQGKADWRETVFSVSPNFDIMSAGSIPQNPTELLGSDRMPSLIDELASQYDIVLYDSSPCLVVSDPSVLCSRVDGVILALRAGANTYSFGVRSKVMFEQLNAHVFGVVLNGVRTKMEEDLRKNYETFYEYSGGQQLAVHS